jgi:hypothetical protein
MTKSGREHKIRNEEVFIHPLTFRHRVNNPNIPKSGDDQKYPVFRDLQIGNFLSLYKKHFIHENTAHFFQILLFYFCC